ncbi:hypothetical protein D3C71_2160900 [compost metagenome]
MSEDDVVHLGWIHPQYLQSLGWTHEEFAPALLRRSFAEAGVDQIDLVVAPQQPDVVLEV